MVASLHPRIESPTDLAPGRLRLVVDNGPAFRSQRSSAGTVRRGNRVEKDAPLDPPLDVAMIVGLALAAVVVFGGLLLIRAAQGSPVSDNWQDVVNDAGVARTAGVADGSTDAKQSGELGTGSADGSDVGIVVAGPGDTMWSVARELAPESDPRPVVAALIDANGGESLQIGQQIVIPKQLLD